MKARKNSPYLIIALVTCCLHVIRTWLWGCTPKNLSWCVISMFWWFDLIVFYTPFCSSDSKYFCETGWSNLRGFWKLSVKNIWDQSTSTWNSREEEKAHMRWPSCRLSFLVDIQPNNIFNYIQLPVSKSIQFGYHTPQRSMSCKCFFTRCFYLPLVPPRKISLYSWWAFDVCQFVEYLNPVLLSVFCWFRFQLCQCSPSKRLKPAFHQVNSWMKLW